jgi:hypothetical protein
MKTIRARNNAVFNLIGTTKSPSLSYMRPIEQILLKDRLNQGDPLDVGSALEQHFCCELDFARSGHYLA